MQVKRKPRRRSSAIRSSARQHAAAKRELRERSSHPQRKRLEAQIEQTLRFETIGRLAGGIVHDFNNVIGVIRGWAEIGEEELPEGNKARERFRKIRQQAEYSSILTRKLLAFTQRQFLQFQNLDLGALVHAVADLLDPLLGDEIQVELALAPDLEPVWADTTQLQQVIMNLCLNARDAMPAGGRITIRTEAVGSKEAAKEASKEMLNMRGSGEAWFRNCAGGKYLLLSISDTGVGMNPKTLARIFEPFFTTKEPAKGTGLGLATVERIIRQHRGTIDVESKLGEGSTFRILLPVRA